MNQTKALLYSRQGIPSSGVVASLESEGFRVVHRNADAFRLGDREHGYSVYVDLNVTPKQVDLIDSVYEGQVTVIVPADDTFPS